MSNLTQAEERDAARSESFIASQKRGVFVDEFGRENPQVSMGSCRPATTGPLAESLRKEIATNFVDSFTVKISQKFVAMIQRFEKKYDKISTLRLLNSEFVDIVTEEFKMALDSQVQLLHEWYGDVRDQIGTKDGQYPPYKEKPKTNNSGLGQIINGMMGGSANENKKRTS